MRIFSASPVFLLLLLCCMQSCRKDIAGEILDDNSSAERSAPLESSLQAVVSSAHWYGTYTFADVTPDDPDEPPGGQPDPDLNPVSDKDFIKNGVAQLPFTNGIGFCNILFDIPSQYTISGDSVIFQAVVQNASSNNGYSSYDVFMQISGTKHDAELHFVADSTAQQYNNYTVGSARYGNLPQLNHYFSSFQTIKWVMKKNGTSAYVNGKLAYRFTYGVANQIGTIKKIAVAGKGFIITDGVKLLNSYNNKKIMTEDFNVDGQSHTIFYR